MSNEYQRSSKGALKEEKNRDEVRKLKNVFEIFSFLTHPVLLYFFSIEWHNENHQNIRRFVMNNPEKIKKLF